MKFIFYTLIFIISQSLLSQTDYSNKLTREHVNIPGTKVFIIPGEGFLVSDNSSGLYKNGNTGITIYDLDGGDFSSNTRNFNRANFETRGFNVLEFYEMKVNEFPAKFVCIEGNGMTSYQLVFGDSTFSVMMMTMHETADIKSGEEIKRMLSMIVYDKSFSFDPLEKSFFSMNVEGSRFKFSQAASNIFNYTIDGKVRDKDYNGPFVMLTALPADEQSTPELTAIIILRELESTGMKNLEIFSRKQSQINGYKSYEVFGAGSVDGNKTHWCLFAIIHGNKSVVFQGYAGKDPDTDFIEFRKLVETIKLK